MDAVTYDLNRYLDRLDRQDRLDAAISERADHLIAKGEACDPLVVGNLLEAVSETGGELFDKIQTALSSSDAESLGRLLIAASREYWSGFARRMAERESDDWCRACHGAGCRQCEYDEDARDD